jgi:hypothetical protein
LSLRKKEKAYELNWKFQDVWVARLPWIKNVLSEDGQLSHIFNARFAQKLWAWKNPSLIIFVKMLVKKKASPFQLIRLES